MRSIEPGISRFRVWSFGPSRNDGSSFLARRRILGSLQPLLQFVSRDFSNLWRPAGRAVKGFRETRERKCEADGLTIARHRLDVDRSRMLQAFDEVRVDIELAPAAQFPTVRIRNWDMRALVDPDCERAVEHALGHQIDRQASLFAVPNGNRDAAAGR